MLRAAIDDALAKQPKTFEALLQIVRESVGKSVTFYKDGQKGIKLHSLGAGYSEAELRDVTAGKATHNPRGKRERASLLVDIQAKLAAGKGVGYERWAKVFNVKQMAKTLLYLQEHGIKSRAELTARTDAASEKLSVLNDCICEFPLENTKQIPSYPKIQGYAFKAMRSDISSSALLPFFWHWRWI